MNEHRLIMIVTAVDRAQANLDAQRAVPNCGPNTFSAKLVPTGSPVGTTPTHFGCSWQLDDNQVVTLRRYLGPSTAPGRVIRRGIGLVHRRTVNGEVEMEFEEVLVEFGLEFARRQMLENV